MRIRQHPRQSPVKSALKQCEYFYGKKQDVLIQSSPSDIRLYDLAKDSIVRAGDVLCYKRNFAAFNIIVEKDVIVSLPNV